MVQSLTSIGGQFGDAIDNIRRVFSSIRGFVSEIIENVFGVFLNLIIEFQKIIISIRDNTINRNVSDQLSQKRSVDFEELKRLETQYELFEEIKRIVGILK